MVSTTRGTLKRVLAPLLNGAVVIEHKTLDYELFKRLCGPYTELRRLVGVYPVADCNNCIKVVEFPIPANLPLPFLLNCFQNKKELFR